MATGSTQSINIEAVNILVIGNVRGQYDFIFDKIKVINDEKKIDIKCHFIIIDCKNDDLLNHDSNKVCDNLCYLGISIDDPCTIDDMLR